MTGWRATACRHRRHRHARAHRAHPRRRRAEWRHLPCAGRRASTSRRCVAQAAAWPGLEGMDLAKEVTCRQSLRLERDGMGLARGLRPADGADASTSSPSTTAPSATSCAASASAGCDVDGGAGDGDAPRRSCATSPTACSSRTARATRRRPATTRCRRSRACWRRGADLRHLPRPPAAGAGARRPRPTSCKFGHRGANQPVKDLTTGKVEITSQNHGFAVDPKRCPASVRGHPRLAVRRHQ